MDYGLIHCCGGQQNVDNEMEETMVTTSDDFGEKFERLKKKFYEKHVFEPDCPQRKYFLCSSHVHESQYNHFYTKRNVKICRDQYCDVKQWLHAELEKLIAEIIAILWLPKSDPDYFYDRIVPAYTTATSLRSGCIGVLDDIALCAMDHGFHFGVNSPEDGFGGTTTILNGLERAELAQLWSTENIVGGYREWLSKNNHSADQRRRTPSPCVSNHRCHNCNQWHCLCALREDGGGQLICVWCQK